MQHCFRSCIPFGLPEDLAESMGATVAQSPPSPLVAHLWTLCKGFFVIRSSGDPICDHDASLDEYYSSCPSAQTVSLRSVGVPGGVYQGARTRSQTASWLFVFINGHEARAAASGDGDTVEQQRAILRPATPDDCVYYWTRKGADSNVGGGAVDPYSYSSVLDGVAPPLQLFRTIHELISH
jgi:hypothetical protein